MLDRFGVGRDDLRNLAIVTVIMTVVMAFQVDGTPLVRGIAGLVAGMVSGLTFLVVTVVINHVKPEPWS